MRNKMKKLMCMFLVFVLVLGLAGCTSKKEETVKKDEKQTEAPKEGKKGEQKEEEYFDLEDASEEDYSKYDNGTAITTDEPVPGKPMPVEPEDAKVDTSKTKTCYLSISCGTILNHMEDLTSGKEGLVPSNGVLYARRAVTFYEGESVFDVLQRETKNSGIHMEYSFTPGFNSNYVEGIANLYEMDCGPNSGWMFCVNGWYPNYGCSRYSVQDQDEIQWNYTCDLGRDL